MDRFYLMPMIGTGIDRTDPRRPKYAATIDAAPGGFWWPPMVYGTQSVCLVKAIVDQATHDTIVADATVDALPQDLEPPVGAGGLAAIQTAFESRNIPGSNLLAATMTWRQVVRAYIVMCQFLQRMEETYQVVFFGGGVTLATTYSALSAAKKAVLQDMATSMSMSTGGVTGATTVRQMLKLMYDQWPASLLRFGGEQW